MASNPNERIFRLNEKIREITKRRLPELEDFFVSLAMEAYREIIKNEPEDPFECLKSTKDTDSDTEEVVVTTRQINGKSYYTFLQDVDCSFNTVHERIPGDGDNESEMGDFMGYMDTKDRFWEAVIVNGEVKSYIYDTLHTYPVGDHKYPDLEIESSFFE